jgi:hypothetical protein
MTPIDNILADFPNLNHGGWQITSDPSEDYNSIAWAAGLTSRWWWPDGLEDWPAGAPCEETITAFAAALGTTGYVPCDNGDWEVDTEKVALYAIGDRPKHAARQLPNGKWTSKLGAGHDIEHDSLGAVVLFLKRQRRDQPAQRGLQ